MNRKLFVNLSLNRLIPNVKEFPIRDTIKELKFLGL